MKIQIGGNAAKRPSTWIVVYDLSKDRILVLKRAKHVNNPNLWNFPGGGIDGQDPRLASKRELFEEAGVKCKKSDLVFLARSKEKDTHYYLLPVASKPKLRVSSKESSAYKWITSQELRRLGEKLHKKTAVFALSKAALARLDAIIRTVRSANKPK